MTAPADHRSTVAPWLCAILAGAGAAIVSPLVSSWIGAAIFGALVTALGAWGAWSRPDAPVRRAAALAGLAAGCAHIVTVVLMYTAPPFEQPSVLPPWPVAAVGAIPLLMWGAGIGGVVGFALSRLRDEP